MEEAWRKFVNEGAAGLDGSDVPQWVLRGWQLSRDLGVDPEGGGAPVLPPDELDRLEGARALREAAGPMLELLRASIQGTGYIASLALASGYLVEVVGDEALMGEARAMGNVPGALRSVAAAGSSAIWMCLEQGAPAQFEGCEHYCRNLHDWRCAAAPVGKAGALAISSHRSRRDSHTLTLARSCADGIAIRLRELNLLEEQKRLNAVLQAALDSLEERVITVNEKGVISHANARAGAFGEKAGAGRPLSGLFTRAAAAGVRQMLRRGRPGTAELEIVSGQGGENRLCRFVPIRLEDGAFGGTIVAIASKRQVMDMVRHVSGNYARYTFGDIMGQAPALRRQVELAQRAAPTQSGILISGESGTGKELFAQAIHNGSAVRGGPFVALSCAAIPRDLIESELFGYVGGAFTGARREGMMGKMELASGGTLFLDEVNSLPYEMQAKLLRALQQKEVTRLGDSRPTAVDIRIIAATNRNLQEAIAEGAFREDLYYRLNVVEISVPPLRERYGDITLLAGLFLGRLCAESGQASPGFSPAALGALEAYPWPGNVRELENACERALLVAGGGRIEPEHLPVAVCGRGAAPRQEGKALERACADSLSEALARFDGNMSRAAAYLGIARSTLYRKLARMEKKGRSVRSDEAER